LRRAGGNARGARGRDHRLDLRPGEVGLAATRSRRAAAQRDEPPGRARHGRERGTGLVEAHVEAHHGPPLAHQSSRVNASVLGMLLFIASEVMLFGSCLTGLHGAHVFVGLSILLFMTIRAFRGHFSPQQHHGVEIGGIYWHFVDVMWIVVYSTVYLI